MTSRIVVALSCAMKMAKRMWKQLFYKMKKRSNLEQTTQKVCCTNAPRNSMTSAKNIQK